MTTIVAVPSVLAGAIVCAAIEDGLLPGRRILVTVNDAEIPEVVPSMGDHPGFDSLAARFDAVVDLNDAIAPHHPHALVAGSRQELTLRDRIRDVAGGGVSRIVAASLHPEPTVALATMFPEASIDVIADQLAAYGPTPARMERDFAGRVERVLYVDLVPETRPRLFADAGAEPVEVTTSAVRTAIALMAATPSPTTTDEAWILDDGLASRRILTADQRDALHRRMLDAAADAGFSEVVFAPHPDARPSYPVALAERAAQRSVRLRVLTGPEPAELLFARRRPRAVLGCSSTALATASALCGIPAFTVGTADVARALHTTGDPHRAALALARATLSSLDAGEQPPLAVPTQTLLDVLCHDMRPDRYARPDDAGRAAAAHCDGAQAFLEAPDPENRDHASRQAGADRAVGRLTALKGSPLGRRLRGVRSVLAAVWFGARL